MTPLLATLLSRKNRVLRETSKYVFDGGHGSPVTLIVLVAVVTMLFTAYIVWRRQMRAIREPNSRALLKELAETLGLSGPQRRLLDRMGRAAGLEPAAALLSDHLLTYLHQRAENAGVTLTERETAHLGNVRQAVLAAATTRSGDGVAEASGS